MFDGLAKEIVGHGPRRYNTVERESDRSGFGLTDENRNQPPCSSDLAQNKHRRVAWNVYSYSDHFHLYHSATLPPKMTF
jgi:hypothetical protein